MKKLVSVCCLLVVVALAVSCAAPQQAAAPQGPDLVITSIKVVTEKVYPAEGKPFSFEFKVKNIGTQDLAEVKTAVKMIVPRIVVYQGKNTFAVSQAIPAIKAGEEVTLQAEALNKETLAPEAAKLTLAKAGDYTMNAVLDPAGYIQEASKDNNKKSISFMVAPKPPEAKK